MNCIPFFNFFIFILYHLEWCHKYSLFIYILYCSLCYMCRNTYIICVHEIQTGEGTFVMCWATKSHEKLQCALMYILHFISRTLAFFLKRFNQLALMLQWRVLFNTSDWNLFYPHQTIQWAIVTCVWDIFVTLFMLPICTVQYMLWPGLQDRQYQNINPH